MGRSISVRPAPQSEINEVVRIASKVYQIPPETMFGPKRAVKLPVAVRARHFVIHALLSGRPERSKTGTAKRLGMDHSTIIKALSKPPPAELDGLPRW